MKRETLSRHGNDERSRTPPRHSRDARSEDAGRRRIINDGKLIAKARNKRAF
jgi:hypothetical protein